jgi:hypothetical protein
MLHENANAYILVSFKYMFIQRCLTRRVAAIKGIRVSNFHGRAIAQAVSRWLPTAAARVRSCGICGRQSGIGQVFSEYFGFPFQSSLHQLLHNHHHRSSGAGTIGQQWPTYQVDSVSPHPEKKKSNFHK